MKASVLHWTHLTCQIAPTPQLPDIYAKHHLGAAFCTMLVEFHAGRKQAHHDLSWLAIMASGEDATWTYASVI